MTKEIETLKRRLAKAERVIKFYSTAVEDFPEIRRHYPYFGFNARSYLDIYKKKKKS